MPSGASVDLCDSNQPNAELLRRAQGGDASAKEELARRILHKGMEYAPRIKSVIQQYCTPMVGIEDVIQEVAIVVTQKLEVVRDIDAYFSGVLRFILLGLKRGEGLRLRTVCSLDAMETWYAEQLASVDPGVVGVDVRVLEEAMGMLPERARTILNLHHTGHTHKEISRILGISEGTSRSVLSRATKALRAALSRAA